MKGHDYVTKEGRKEGKERLLQNPQPKKHLKDPSFKHTLTKKETHAHEHELRRDKLQEI